MRASCVGFVWPGDRCGWLSAYSALCFDPSPIHLGHNMADSSSGLVLNQAMMWCWHCVCSCEFNIHCYPIKWCQFMSGSVPSVSFVTLNHECHFLTLPRTHMQAWLYNVLPWVSMATGSTVGGFAVNWVISHSELLSCLSAGVHGLQWAMRGCE